MFYVTIVTKPKCKHITTIQKYHLYKYNKNIIYNSYAFPIHFLLKCLNTFYLSIFYYQFLNSFFEGKIYNDNIEKHSFSCPQQFVLNWLHCSIGSTVTLTSSCGISYKLIHFFNAFIYLLVKFKEKTLSKSNKSK